MRALPFDPYLLLPAADARAGVDGYTVAPVREALHALEREVAQSGGRGLLSFWAARNGHPLVLGANTGALRRALDWARSGLERSPQGLVMLRRITPLIAGELALRTLPPPPPAKDQPVDKRDWIEFELLDKDGDPVRGLPFAVTQGEDTITQGKLNRFANVFLDRIDPGSYTFALTAEPMPEPLEPTEWLALELLSEGGRPLAGEKVRLVDSAGGVHEAEADAFGRVVLYAVAPGDCQLTFPGLLKPEA